MLLQLLELLELLELQPFVFLFNETKQSVERKKEPCPQWVSSKVYYGMFQPVSSFAGHFRDGLRDRRADRSSA